MENKRIFIIGGSIIAVAALLFLSLKGKARGRQVGSQSDNQSSGTGDSQRLDSIQTREEMMEFLYTNFMNKTNSDKSGEMEANPNFNLNYKEWLNIEPKLAPLTLEELKMLYTCEATEKASLTPQLYRDCQMLGQKYPNILS